MSSRMRILKKVTVGEAVTKGQIKSLHNAVALNLFLGAKFYSHQVEKFSKSGIVPKLDDNS